MCPRGPGVPRPLRPLCQCPRSSVRAPSSAASAAPGAPGKRRTHPALAQGSLVGKEGMVVGPGDRLEPQILDDSCCFIPEKRRTHPHCCPGVIGQQRGDGERSREALEPQNLDNSCCFSLLSRGWEINGQWACSDGVTGSLCPFCACKAQRGWQVPGVAATSARAGRDRPVQPPAPPQTGTRVPQTGTKVPQTGTRVPPAQPPLSSPQPPFPNHPAPLPDSSCLLLFISPEGTQNLPNLGWQITEAQEMKTPGQH